MEPDTQANEPSGIGDLEAAVLNLVKTVGRGSVSEILARAKGQRRMAYTTLSTTLDRLYRKGLLARDTAVGKGGKHYIYSCREDSTLQKEIVTRTVDRLVSAFGANAVSNIYERLEQLSPSEVEALRELIQRRNKPV